MNLRISAWAIRNPIPVAMLFILLTVAGAVAYLRLPVKMFPNASLPIVTVTVTQSGAAPAEMENQITRPIENALTGVSGIKNINSTITTGTSSTTVEFETGTEIQRAVDCPTASIRPRCNGSTSITPRSQPMRSAPPT